MVASKYPERVLKSLARGQEMQRATLAHLRHSFLPADSREWRGDEWGRLNPFFVHLPDLGEQPLQLNCAYESDHQEEHCVLGKGKGVGSSRQSARDPYPREGPGRLSKSKATQATTSFS